MANKSKYDLMMLDAVADELKLSISVVQQLLGAGELTVYAPTPSTLYPDKDNGCGVDYIFPLNMALAYLYKEPLAKYCVVKPPLNWEEKWNKEKVVQCRTIIVTTDKGEIPTREKYFSAKGFFFGKDGEITHEDGDWTFNNRETLISKQEFADYVTNRQAWKKSKNLLQKAYAEAVLIYEAIKDKGFDLATDKLKAVAESTIVQNKNKFVKISKKHLNNDQLFEVFGKGQNRRDFIGKLLQIVCMDNGIKEKNYQLLYDKAKKLTK